MWRTSRIALILPAMLVVEHAAAQVKVGDLSTDLSGSLSAGYTADYGNLTASDHGLTLGGTATLSGYYYNPNLLSFNIQPFYNQSRSNSDFQSITDASGVNASASIFSGTNFPGSISFTDVFNSESNFGIPGVGNYASHGDSKVFSIGWSEHVPKYPTLTFNYQQGASQYSIYGTDSNSTSDFHSFAVISSYSLVGFNLNAAYHYSVSQSQLPQLFENEPAENSTADTSTFTIGLGHKLPFHGNFSAGGTHTDLSVDSTLSRYDGTLDSAYAGAIFNPIERLTIGSNAQYLDNLTGALYQSIVSSGGIAQTIPMDSSHALNLTAFASYLVPAVHLSFNATDQYQAQHFAGNTFDSNSITGSTTYSNIVKGGVLNATLGIIRSTIGTGLGARLGLIASTNYTRELGPWSLSAGANYTQDQQTLLATYLTNSLGYSGTAGRRLGRRRSWSGSVSGTKTGLQNQPQSASFSQNYSTSLFIRWIEGSAAYSRSSGNAILTGTGLVATPIPLPVITPSAVVLYGGHAYSFGLGATPVRGLTMSVAYSQAYSNTNDVTQISTNKTSQLTARILYVVRKIYFQAGYARLTQDFSASGSPPSMLASFYFGATRWFNFF